MYKIANKDPDNTYNIVTTYTISLDTAKIIRDYIESRYAVMMEIVVLDDHFLPVNPPGLALVSPGIDHAIGPLKVKTADLDLIVDFFNTSISKPVFTEEKPFIRMKCWQYNIAFSKTEFWELHKIVNDRSDELMKLNKEFWVKYE